jgi:hypothetical protein
VERWLRGMVSFSRLLKILRQLNIHRTSYWITKLDHKFGDDGIFWIRFEDMLKEFPRVHRTRLFTGWQVAQSWTRVNVAWVTGYLKKKFTIKIPEDGPVVIVLSQVSRNTTNTGYIVDISGSSTIDISKVSRASTTSNFTSSCGRSQRVRTVEITTLSSTREAVSVIDLSAQKSSLKRASMKFCPRSRRSETPKSHLSRML